MPAVALASQDAQRVGHLGPGHRIGDELNPSGTAVLICAASQAGNEFHVLSDGVVFISTGGEHRVAAEESKGAGDDEVAPQAVPAQATGQERAQVLDGLQSG